MDAVIVRRLIDINLQFYQTFAHHFSATRGRLQPGVRRIIEQMPVRLNIIDLGCGNGELAIRLAGSRRCGVYVGLDSSSEMLKIAIKRVNTHKLEQGNCLSQDLKINFLQADLTESKWSKDIPTQLYDYVLAFAVLHHLPGNPLRLQILRQVREILAPEGCFIHSEWQFLSSKRLRSRILPWETVAIGENQVDPGDYLLDWKQGGYGIRYVHHFSEVELTQLAQESGFEINQSFLSDGADGKLGLYQVWQVKGDKII